MPAYARGPPGSACPASARPRLAARPGEPARQRDADAAHERGVEAVRGLDEQPGAARVDQHEARCGRRPSPSRAARSTNRQSASGAVEALEAAVGEAHLVERRAARGLLGVRRRRAAGGGRGRGLRGGGGAGGGAESAVAPRGRAREAVPASWPSPSKGRTPAASTARAIAGDRGRSGSSSTHTGDGAAARTSARRAARGRGGRGGFGDTRTRPRPSSASAQERRVDVLGRVDVGAVRLVGPQRLRRPRPTASHPRVRAYGLTRGSPASRASTASGRNCTPRRRRISRRASRASTACGGRGARASSRRTPRPRR